MKKLIKLILFSIILLLSSLAQAQNDPHDGEIYLSVMPAFYTSSTGGGALQANVNQRITSAIEIGKQWDVISVGLNIGKTTLESTRGRDTVSEVVPAGKWYLEARPNLNVFQQGKFSNTMTIGAGLVIGSDQFLMTELTTGIEYTPNSTYSYNINVGTYYFTGNGVGSNQVFFGASITKYFKKNHHKIHHKWR